VQYRQLCPAMRLRVRFQHDGAPPHSTRQGLSENYPAFWTGREAPTFWPPNSSDLGYFKTIVHASTAHTTERNCGVVSNNLQDKQRTCQESPNACEFILHEELNSVLEKRGTLVRK
jgi:hypothetical protein